MDDLSQNDPGIQQKPTIETNGNPPSYQPVAQASVPAPAAAPILPVADTPPKRRNPIILAAIGILLLLILAAAALFVQNRLSHRTVACADAKCFDQRFAKCLPSAYTDSTPDGSVKYTIATNQGIGCTVNVSYLRAKYSTDVVGKSMTCDFDNGLDFQTAAQNVFRFPDDYSCKGNLADVFKSVNNTPGGS